MKKQKNKTTKKKKKKHVNKISSANFNIEDDLDSTLKASTTIFTEQDLESKEKKLDELIKQAGGDILEVNDGDGDSEISDLEDDDDSISIQKKIFKLKLKLSRLRDKAKRNNKKQKKYEEKIKNLKTE